MEFNVMIKRINELAHKKKSIGLNETEQSEQKELYRLYLANIRSQLEAQLENITIIDENSEENQDHV